MINDFGLLASRLALGLGLASHGAQKAFGWFEGPGPEGAAGFMESLDFKPGAKYAMAASYTEIGSGLLMALGLGGPLGPAAAISTMIVAAETVHLKNGFFAAKGGAEVNVLYSAGALALASAGYGNLSMDHVLGLESKVHHPAFKTLVLAGAVAAAYAMLAQRDTSPPEGTLATPTIPGDHERNGAPSGSAPSSAAT
jgi:putative oxidoreductase